MTSSRQPLRRTDGGPLIAAVSAVAAAGALYLALLPFLYVALPLVLVAGLVAAAIRRELRIRRRLRDLGPVTGRQALPAAPRPAVPAAPRQLEGGASL